MINELLFKIDSEYLHYDLKRVLEIEPDTPKRERWSASGSHQSLLNKTLGELKITNHCKSKRYTLEEIEELGRVLDLFPEDHQKVQRALKIPISTFRRLRTEWRSVKCNENSSKRKSTNDWNLTVLERSLIEKLMKPPTYPWTITNI